MKYRKLLLVIMIIFSLPMINYGQLLVEGSEINYNYQSIKDAEEPLEGYNGEDYNSGENYVERVVSNIDESTITLENEWEENNISLTSMLDSFNPNISIEADYEGQQITGKIENGDSIITVPNQGEYNIEGSITDMEVQYLQNPGAEEEESFYSESVIQAGLSIERVEDIRSIEGDYVWKFYSSNTETMTYSLYQKNIELYQTDTHITYNYLLESNSSLQNIINSSLIFDIIFDTCRIMIIHWHYTDIYPPEIGENTTTPFIVYRFLENSSWDDQWNSYSLSISDLFSQGDPYIPSILKSIGIYVISPEYSECSLLIDDFKVTSSVSPNDIGLELNDVIVSDTSINSGTIGIETVIDGIMNNNINLIWYHNSIFEIRANYLLNVTGTIIISFNQSVVLEADSTVSYTISTNEVISEINEINITYPDYWILDENIEDFTIQNIENIDEMRSVLTLVKSNPTTILNCQFTIQNLINETMIFETTIFEVLEGTITFNGMISDIPVYVFWSGPEEGSLTGTITDGTLNLMFPSWIQSGMYDLTFIIIEAEKIGFTKATIELMREPAQLITIDELEMPHYALQTISIDYLDLVIEQEIEKSEIRAYLDDEEISLKIVENSFKLDLSAFYLDIGTFELIIVATSPTHATVTKTIQITVVESILQPSFTYKKMDSLLLYQFNYSVTANGIPVGNAPVKIEMETVGTITGITDSTGKYVFEKQLSLNQKEIYVNCSLIHKYNPISTESYTIQFRDLQATITQEGETKASSENITLGYKIQYPATHDRWFVIIEEEMTPIVDAYIEAESLIIPVYWDENIIYWETEIENDNENHILIIETIGPEIITNIEEQDSGILIHFIINANTKSYSNISLIYYLNDSYATSKYVWQLISSKNEDVTEQYELQINDLYALLSNINIVKGSYLILDLVGTRTSNSNSITSILIPVVSSSSVLLGAIATIVKVYNKKKGMILEI